MKRSYVFSDCIPSDFKLMIIRRFFFIDFMSE